MAVARMAEADSPGRGDIGLPEAPARNASALRPQIRKGGAKRGRRLSAALRRAAGPAGRPVRYRAKLFASGRQQGARKRHYARMACASALRGDISFASCASWCKPSETHHCDWCKCRACDFCHHGLDSFALAPSVVVPQNSNCGPATSVGPLRLSACGADLFSSDGERRPVLLSGVNMYLEWLVKYRDKVIGPRGSL